MPTFRVRVVKSTVYAIDAPSPEAARGIAEAAVVGQRGRSVEKGPGSRPAARLEVVERGVVSLACEPQPGSPPTPAPAARPSEEP